MQYIKQKRLFQWITMIVTISSLQSYAALDLELTQGTEAPLPIAVPAFFHEPINASGNESISQIIAQDLQNSGLFRVISSSSALNSPKEKEAGYWRKKGADDVLLGQVQHSGQSYRVSFQLINTINKTERFPKQSTEASLLSQTYTTNQAGLRQLAHRISDAVYQKLTGTRGIFSTKVAYILVQSEWNQPKKYSLEVADIDGFNPQAVLVSAQPIMSPTWSPNGKKIAYVSFEGHHAGIYIQTLDSGQRQLISSHPGINGAPAFSPDGKKLALVLTLTGSPKLYIDDLKAKKLTQLTTGYSIDTEPAWAPDGQSILFTSNRGGGPQIYRYVLSKHQIDRVSFDGNYNAHASFLPDGKQMIMMHRDTGLFGIASQVLGSGIVSVLTQTGADESPSVAPNGKSIIYATEYSGREVLALVSTDGQIKLRLPAREGNVREPAWSPFLNNETIKESS